MSTIGTHMNNKYFITVITNKPVFVRIIRCVISKYSTAAYYCAIACLLVL